MAVLSDRESVGAYVEALRERWRAVAEPSSELRASIDGALVELRALYRTTPGLFDDRALATLRLLAHAVKEPPKRDWGGVRPDAPSPNDVLRSVFGFESFRRGQREIIDAILSGRDCIGVMPTGAGKSVTFQIPARVLGGTTLVISPLIALMKDQVDALSDVGVRSTFLNSSLTADERRARVDALIRGEFELLYAAPEGIEASVGSILDRINLRFVAVDEAHCISQWGHDFRPAYRNLAGLKRRFGGVPVLALTATATPQVTNDIIEQLRMSDPLRVQASFFRPNLRIETIKKGAERSEATRDSIARYIATRRGESGVVYCLSRKSVESLTEFLSSRGIRALGYHAGMAPEERTRAQDAFRDDDADVIVATVAFGMGIDKSNVRFVIHRDMPRSLEGYYQEIGRAGRDGVESDCILFYSWADVIGHDRLQTEGDEEIQLRRARQVREMFRYADAGECRHARLVAYFGERIDACGSSCDVCARESLLERAIAKARLARPPREDRVRSERDTISSRAKKEADLESLDDADLELLGRLKEKRRELAKARGVPAYVVFSDAVLIRMAAERPRSLDELLRISGIGPAKLSLYGAEFLSVLR